MYFFGMKFLFSVIVLVSILSCNDTPQKTSSRPRISTDSNVVKQQSTNPYVAVDISPMDMSWLPTDYPKMSDRKSLPIARVIYSRPHKQGRKIFGSLLKYGEPWRLGANEATEIELFQPVKIQGKTISRGRYVLYCIPQEDKWTIVFNSNLYSWGLTPDPKKDLFHFDIPAVKKNQSVEYFSVIFQPSGTGADLVMAWDDTEARLPLEYSEH